MAVDQSNGDIYAIDKEGVSRFTPAGAPDNFTAGPDAGANTLTGFTINGSGGSNARGVAIDNSGGALNGSIYVVDQGSNGVAPGTVKAFAKDGTPLGALDGSGNDEGSFREPCGVTVDQSNGDVYVSQNNGKGSYGKIWRYAQKSPAAPIDDADFAVTGVSTDRVCGVAADSGSVYAAGSNPGGTGRLFKYPASAFVADPPSENIGTVVDQGPVSAVYVDSQNGDVYANEGRRVAVYDTGGARLYDFGYAADFGTESEGIAVKSAASGAAAKVYVADRHPGGNQIDVFGAITSVPLLTHPTVATFGKDGTSASSFSQLGQLAFDQADRRLFALDGGAPGIFGFDAFAPPAYPTIDGFAPLTTPVPGESSGLAVDNTALGSAGNLYLVSQNTDLLYGFDSTGVALSGFPVDPATAPGAPEGSPKDLCGAAVDSAGNVWASNRSTKRILKYSSAGASLPGSIDTSAKGGPCRIAFDSNDNLYVEVSESVWRYSAASSYATATLVENVPRIRGIAVDPTTDDLYVAHDKWVDQYDSAGGFVDEFATDVPGSSFTGIAIDPANHYAYIADAGNGKIHVFGPGVILPEVTIGSASGATNTAATLHGSVGPQGAALTDCHFEYVSGAAFHASGFSDLSSGGAVPCSPASGSISADFGSHPVEASVSGLTRSTTYYFRLVAANATASSNSSEAQLTTPGPAMVETTGAPIRTMTSAQLGGRVDPRNEAATYFFEYGDQGPCDANPCIQTEPKSAGTSDFIELVSEEVSGLQPNTTYHYRILADNGNPDGAVVGNDATVTTRSEEAPLSHGRFPGPPDSDRAWEQVNAADIGGNSVEGPASISDDGTRAIWELFGGSPLSETGGFNQFYSERTPSGWQTRKIYPLRNELSGPNWQAPSGLSNLSAFVALNANFTGGGFGLFRMSPGLPAVKLYEVATEAEYGFYNAMSDDGSRVLMATKTSADPEHPTVPATTNVFDVTSGSPHLVNLLPGELVPACGFALAGTPSPYTMQASVAARASHWLSADGDRFFFGSSGSTCSAHSQLYMRDLQRGETKLLSGPSLSPLKCGAGFIKSTPEAAFFWTKDRLTVEDSAPANCDDETSDGDVYRYDIGDGGLTCVTCVAPGTDADVFVHGAEPSSRVVVADDGSRVYFESSSQLLPGARTSGIYRVNVGTGDLAYVSSISNFDALSSAVTPDGADLFFSSSDTHLDPLGGGAGNAGTKQLYRYDDNDRSLVCVSCPRDGGAPRGDASGAGGGNANPNATPISDQGIFAFTTPTPLVAADQNTAAAGQDPGRGTDAYEWRGGRLFLLTDGLTNWAGTATAPRVKGMTPSGRDILFTAATQYTEDALDDFRRLYDARIGGGIEFPKPPTPCPLEVCQGTPKGSPEEAAPGTGSFAGPGNVVQHKPGRCSAGKRKARRAGKTRCVSKKQHTKTKARHNRRTTR
jgi:hypothetical protein